jgi:hypothetical protein
MTTARPRRNPSLALAALALSACATARLAPALPENPTSQARCQVAASQASPLVTEWPASEKANLEALLRTGAVAVEYSGCSLRVLAQCRLGGAYRWQRTTPASEVLEIRNEDELYAKLPLGAVSLEGELARKGNLTVKTQVAGHLRLEGLLPSGIPPGGECAHATHVVGAISVGAFSLSAGAGGNVGAGVSVESLGSAGGKIDRSLSLLRSAGDPDTCGAASDGGPAWSCASPVQVFLWGIPGRAAEEGPPGTVKVDLVSASANARWDVYYDDQVICTTPCTRWLDPTRPVLLRAREDGGFGPFASSDKIRLQGLGEAAAAGAVQVQAVPTSRGQLATGIVFTSFGGMAVLTGGMLMIAGCSDGDHGMCSSGGITLAAGALVTAGSIWLMVDSLPRAEIVPSGQRPGYGAVVRIGPGVVSGRF